VTVPGSTKALDGSELGTDAQTFEFYTERLAPTLDIVGSRERATKDQIVTVNFSQVVAFEQVAQHCGFSAGSVQLKAKRAPDGAVGPAKSFTFVPDGELKMDHDWKVTCRAGLKGTVGKPRARRGRRGQFHTYGPLRFISLDRARTTSSRREPAARARVHEPARAALPDQDRSAGPGVPRAVSRASAMRGRAQLRRAARSADRRIRWVIDATQKDIFGQTLGSTPCGRSGTDRCQPTISMESANFVAELKRPVIRCGRAT